MAALARRRRRDAGQRAPDAAGRAVRPPGPGLGRGARHPGDRLQGRGAQAPDRRGLPARAHGRGGRVPDPGGAGAGDGVEGQPHRRRGDPQPGEDAAVRQPLLVPHHGPDLGAPDDQDERAPAVRRAGDPQRPRVRRLRRPRRPAYGFAKEGNCFTRIDDPERLAQVADTLSQPGTVGRLGQVIDRWIYTACLCFGLDLAEQQRSGFGYAYSIYQVEYSRNLIFASGAVMERAFDTVVDRTRSRLDVPKLRTLFGVGQRPREPRRRICRLDRQS